MNQHRGRRILWAVLVLQALALIMLAAWRPASGQLAQAVPQVQSAGGEGNDLLGLQHYWQLKRGHVTATAFRSAQSRAAALPAAHTLPPANRPDLTSGTMQPQGPSTTWTSIGPSPLLAASGNTTYDTSAGATNHGYAGRVQAIAVDPTTSGSSTVIYQGTANGGVWKSSDNGGHWAPLTDNQPSLAIGALAIDPNNHNTIYAGTGEPDWSIDSYLGQGVLKSTDGGATWTLEGQSVFLKDNNGIGKIVVNPANSNEVWAAGYGGLYQSTDAGVTWTQVSGGSGTGSLPPGQVDDIAFNPTLSGSVASATIYAAVRYAGLYRSTDDGATWTLLGQSAPNTGTVTLPAGTDWYRSAIAMAPSNPGTLYLVVNNINSVIYQSGSYNGGYYTTDGGDTWLPMTSLNLNFTSWNMDSATSGQGWYDLWLAVDPHNDRMLYGGGVHVAMSPDAQSATGNWQDIMGNGAPTSNPSLALPHADQHAIAFAPGCSAAPCPFYSGDDGGIFENQTPSLSGSTYTPGWVDLNTAGLTTLLFTGGDLGKNFTSNSLALGGTQDNGTALKTSSAFGRSFGGDGGLTAVDWSNEQNLYSEYTSQYFLKSADGGNTWNWSYSGLPSDALFYAPFAIDRSNPSHLVWGGSGVYESSNGASSWYQGSQAIEGTSSCNSCVSAVAIAPSSSKTIYAGTENGQLYRTTTGNAGTQQTYSQIDNGNFGSHFVSGIAVDPTSPDTVYVALGTFCPCQSGQGGYVWKTTNGGSTWTNITGGLPSYPVNAIVEYHSGSSNVVVIGTDFGVFYTTDDGAHWTGLTSGLPNVSVVGLSIDQAQTALVAWTHGRSAWKTAIPGISAPSASLSLNPGTGVYGQKISVTGGGYGNAKTVKLYWGSAGGTQPTGFPVKTTSTSGGAITTKFTVPRASLGNHQLVAVSGNGAQGTQTLSVNPSATLQYAKLAPGGTDTVTGYGFQAGETVTATWNSATGPQLGTGQATDSAGTTTPAISFTVPAAPALASGTYTVYLTGGTSGATATATFSILPTLGISPSSGKRGSIMTIKGAGFGAGDSISILWRCSAISCSSPVKLTTTPAAAGDSTGSFSVTALVPSGATTGTTYSLAGKGTAVKVKAYSTYKVTS